MDNTTESLLQTFWNSNEFTWERSKELKEIISSAVERNDQEILCAFVSRPMNTSGTFPQGPSRDWILLCKDVIFPAFSKNITEEALTSVSIALRDYYGSVGDFVRDALSLLKKGGALSCQPLCELVATGKSPINGRKIDFSTWQKAVELLPSAKCKEATASIVRGMFRRCENEKPFDNDMRIAVSTIIELNAEETESALEQLLSHPNPAFRYSAVSAIGDLGNKRALEPLSKRIGGFFNKPESDSSIRENIKKAIQKIKSRGN